MVVSSKRFTKQLHQYRSQPGLNPIPRCLKLELWKIYPIHTAAGNTIWYENKDFTGDLTKDFCLYIFDNMVEPFFKDCGGDGVHAMELRLLFFCCSAVATIAIGSGVYGWSWSHCAVVVSWYLDNQNSAFRMPNSWNSLGKWNHIRAKSKWIQTGPRPLRAGRTGGRTIWMIWDARVKSCTLHR